MMKLSVVIFVVAISSVLSQEVTLECQFAESLLNDVDYACLFYGVTHTDPTANVIIGGEHYENRSNDDVNVLLILYCDMPFLAPEIFTTFPNLRDIEIDYSNLNTLTIPNTVQLEFLYLYGNNIPRIDSDSISGQERLEFVLMAWNHIQEIAEDAFVGLGELIILTLYFNDIAQIEPQTFQPLVNVQVIDLEDNLLTRIDDIFSENRMMTNLYMEYNMIEEVHPNFNANLRENLGTFYAFGNRCINSGFYIYDEHDFAVINNAMRHCYHNFNGSESEDKTIGMNFGGNLRIYDQFGNIIGRV